MPPKQTAYFAMVDVGGTSVKSALLSSEREIVENSYSIASIDARGSSEQIIGIVISVLKKQLSQIPGELTGIGFCFPGPFDYGQGVSLMKHKLSSIYGTNLKDEVIERLGLAQDFPIVFEEDSIAFLKGEARVGNATGFDRIIGLTLGAGLGAAFMVNGEIVQDGPDIPPDGELWCLPDNGGIMEDKVSRRGIVRIYQGMTGDSEDNVETIAHRAKLGDADSIQTFEEFGRVMGRLLRPHAERFGAECIVVGGQIAKSFGLFGPSLWEELSALPSLGKITRAKFIEFSPFLGLFFDMKGGNGGC